MGGSVESGDGEVGFQIAPMVDVVFVIMLFFMASAGMQVSETELGMSLPSGGGAGSSVNVPLVVTIEPNGQVMIDNRPFDNPTSKGLPQLKTRLTDLMARFPENPVIIRPNPATLQDRVIDVLNAAAAAKVKNLTFG